MAGPVNTFTLKLKVHCKYCARKLEKRLLKINGVHSVKIDQELGKVAITGKVDPAKILSKFEKEGREAELWCEHDQSRKDSNVLSEVIDPLNDPDIMAQLEKFSDNSSVKSVEVTKTMKVTFKGESRDGPNEKIVEIKTTKNVKNTHDDQVHPHDHSHGGGLCGASSSCCGGHSAINHNLNHGCCQYGNTTSFGPCCAHGRNSCYYHNQYGNNTSSGPCCTHSRQYGNGTSCGFCYGNSISPSAPPLPDDYYQMPLSSAMADDYHQASPLPPSSRYYYQAPPLSSAMPDDYYQAPPTLAKPHPYYSCIIL